jgi:sortase (surface protein transpeptidase)
VYPTAIRIRSIAVNNNQFMQVGLLPNGELEVPPLTDPKLIAWYRMSAVPGDPGPKPSIVESHINGDQIQGGFAKLDSVKVGDEIQVDRSDQQTAVFKVTATNLYVKTQYDSWKAKVFGNVSHPTLKLITCSGDYDKVHRNYLSNRIVSADLVRLEPKSP